jgi:hypothetical protein
MMKRVLLYGVVALCLSHPAFNACSQSMSHEEEVVRTTYTKLSFLCRITPLSRAAKKQLVGAQVDPVKLDADINAAAPVFTLSNFQVGPIASIANETWGEFVTAPRPGDQALDGSWTTEQYGDNGIQSEWSEIEVHWAPAPAASPEVEKAMLDLTVAAVIKLASKQWYQFPVTYTRYAAFTVDVSFQGKSTGPHKAIFFFGTDAKGKEVVAQNDLLSGPMALWDVPQKQAYPAGLLRSRMRDVPVVANWVRANEMPAASCTSTKGDLCCTHDRCGISEADLNRDLAAKLPTPTN